MRDTILSFGFLQPRIRGARCVFSQKIEIPEIQYLCLLIIYAHFRTELFFHVAFAEKATFARRVTRVGLDRFPLQL